jgi:hypothetical protein
MLLDSCPNTDFHLEMGWLYPIAVEFSFSLGK